MKDGVFVKKRPGTWFHQYVLLKEAIKTDKLRYEQGDPLTLSISHNRAKPAFAVKFYGTSKPRHIPDIKFKYSSKNKKDDDDTCQSCCQCSCHHRKHTDTDTDTVKPSDRIPPKQPSDEKRGLQTNKSDEVTMTNHKQAKRVEVNGKSSTTTNHKQAKRVEVNGKSSITTNHKQAKNVEVNGISSTTTNYKQAKHVEVNGISNTKLWLDIMKNTQMVREKLSCKAPINFYETPEYKPRPDIQFGFFSVENEPIPDGQMSTQDSPVTSNNNRQVGLENTRRQVSQSFKIIVMV